VNPSLVQISIEANEKRAFDGAVISKVTEAPGAIGGGPAGDGVTFQSNTDGLASNAPTAASRLPFSAISLVATVAELPTRHNENPRS
jgi:hypothetical protein